MANDKIRKNYKDIADAIRSKTGTHNKMTAAEMPQKISEIKTGIEPTGTKEIRNNGEFNIREFEKVDVNVPGATTKELFEATANGTYDIAEYANVKVDVPNPSSGVLDITENGEYDVTEKAGVAVNVQSTGNNPLQDMLDRSSDTDGSWLFSADAQKSSYYNIFSKLGNEDLAALDFSNKHYTNTSYMFRSCSSLTTIPQLNFSSVTNANSMFLMCSSLTTIPQLNFSSVTDATDMFASCTNLTTIQQLDFSSVTTSNTMFASCTNLTTLDFSNIKTVGRLFALEATSLSTLIIRNPTTLATLEWANAFSNTPIAKAKGTGYIYVPDDLVGSYKQATNWSNFADQIKPLSELPQGD